MNEFNDFGARLKDSKKIQNKILFFLPMKKVKSIKT